VHRRTYPAESPDIASVTQDRRRAIGDSGDE